MASSLGEDHIGTETESPAFVRENPYYRPIAGFARNIVEIEWRFPFLPSLIQAGIIGVVIIILCCLYATIGIASQISNTFVILIEDAARRVRHGSSVEKSAVTLWQLGYTLLYFFHSGSFNLPSNYLAGAGANSGCSHSCG